ncbi:probable purple acid phosphatase 20 [Chenopodium quinoa]|uniref:probable purple acid phosphatase 20 n=1 Tax=Chenopodium quinoa TaxID=63459 RepID=UPI000B76CDD8|nr:probable purple acid phosphatase 20 [Chenopodium quinoa]
MRGNKMISSMSMANASLLMAISAIIWAAFNSDVASNIRPPPQETRSITTDSHSSTTPQQVHISTVGRDHMRISWITKKPAPSKVEYGMSSGEYDSSAIGSCTSYRYFLYKSGHIHEVVIGPLNPNTVYYYRCSGHSSREFNFKTTPPQLPLKFIVIGDLGQTKWTESTLQHISQVEYDMLLLPGDLSYADFWQPYWDSFGRLVEPLASQRPWMVTIGNHEVEKIPIIHPTPFTSYNARWHMPFEESESPSNLYYSFDVASEVHVIMLGSYTDFDQGSSQYTWLEGDLKKVNRKKTSWVVVVLHAPWYNSNMAHVGEYESVDMRKAMEQLLYDARVDIVFAGHVHAYERFTRVYDGKANKCGPMHITIGDGGNREGLARKFMDPKPEISIYREASFGHGQLQVVNSTHAQWTWHRNEDNLPKADDSVWLTSLISDLDCKPQ